MAETTIKVVKGPQATAAKFCFRVSKDKRFEVGDKPVTVSKQIAQPYVDAGYLTSTDTPEPKKEPAKVAK